MQRDGPLSGSPARLTAYRCVGCFNRRHMLWATFDACVRHAQTLRRELDVVVFFQEANERDIAAFTDIGNHLLDQPPSIFHFERRLIFIPSFFNFFSIRS